MPTYDYECSECGHVWELFQGITAKPIRKCPSCGKLKAKRLIGTGAGIIFRGSGFYETDYRSESYKQAAKADQEAAKGKDTKSETKTDSKSTEAGRGTSTNSPAKTGGDAPGGKSPASGSPSSNGGKRKTA